MHDPVNHPEHYTSSEAKCECCGKHIECIDITQHMNFCTGNAVKYIWRAEKKGNFAQDIRKAIWYLQKELDREVPETREAEAKIAPGVYVQLLRGREDPYSNEDGNYRISHYIGPFDSYHQSYGGKSLRLLGFGGSIRESWFMDHSMVNGLIYYDGLYYSDWSISSHNLIEQGEEIRAFDPELAVPNV